MFLHILFQSTISLLHRPALMRRFNNELPSVPEPSLAPVASSAARTIADILSLADALDEVSYIASPFLDQLVLPAGRAFLSEREVTREALRRAGVTLGDSHPPSRHDPNDTNANRTNLLSVTRSWAETNLATCQQVLDKLAVFWGGATWPARALEQETAGATEDVDPDANDDDAQNAPIHDVEMVLKWAKEKIKQARDHPNGSGQQSKTPAAASDHGLPEAFSPQGFGISGVMGTEADLDLDALLSSWGGQASGATTPFPRIITTVPTQTLQGPPVDFNTLQLEELLGNMEKDDVFPLNIAHEDAALFGSMLF